MKIKKVNIGSRFDDWLKEEGLYEEVTAVAIKRIMAKRTNNGQASIERLLDPRKDSKQLPPSGGKSA